MSDNEFEFNPVEFITIGTIGPKGQRVFHLQAGHDGQIITFVIEKEQAFALSEAITQFMEELESRTDQLFEVEMAALDMDLREPIQPMFRISQMALAYEESSDMVILVAQELGGGEEDDESGVVRLWCTPEQMLALSIQAMDMYDSGRPSPRQNGHITYYWM